MATMRQFNCTECGSANDVQADESEINSALLLCAICDCSQQFCFPTSSEMPSKPEKLQKSKPACDAWDSTWGEGIEDLETSQKRKHAQDEDSHTFLAEIVQGIRVREAEDARKPRRGRVHASLPLPACHAITDKVPKLMISPLTFLVEKESIRAPATGHCTSPCTFRLSEYSELQTTVKKDGAQAAHMQRKKRSVPGAKSAEFPVSLNFW